MNPEPPPLLGLAIYLGALLAQRAHELAMSARNARALRERGATERGSLNHLFLVFIHAVLPLALAAEVIFGGARPSSNWPVFLAFLLAAEGMRLASMRALGPLWTARVLVVPAQARLTRGIYRCFRHPSYLAAAIELAAAPLMFGAWRTAAVMSVLNLPAIAVRIRQEDNALASHPKVSPQD